MALFILLNDTTNLYIYLGFLIFGSLISLFISYKVIMKTDDTKVEPRFWIHRLS